MILSTKSYQSLLDEPISFECPYCNKASGMELISAPIHQRVTRFELQYVILGYMCSSCREQTPLLFKFGENVHVYKDSGDLPIRTSYYDIMTPQQLKFEHDKYLPEIIKTDLDEALSCYSVGAFNGFAAMCRRTIQSCLTELGAKGKDRIKSQMSDLKEIYNIDNDTVSILEQVIIDSHDGAHPHLPKLDNTRAELLLELIKDILYQLFVRKAKLKEASKSRLVAIEKKKKDS